MSLMPSPYLELPQLFPDDDPTLLLSPISPSGDFGALDGCCSSTTAGSPTPSNGSSGSSTSTSTTSLELPLLLPATTCFPPPLPTLVPPPPDSISQQLLLPLPPVNTSKQQRKIKNREAARLSRQRKLDQQRHQQEELRNLELENQRLRQQLASALEENQKLKAVLHERSGGSALLSSGSMDVVDDDHAPLEKKRRLEECDEEAGVRLYMPAKMTTMLTSLALLLGTVLFLALGPITPSIDQQPSPWFAHRQLLALPEASMASPAPRTPSIDGPPATPLLDATPCPSSAVNVPPQLGIFGQPVDAARWLTQNSQKSFLEGHSAALTSPATAYLQHHHQQQQQPSLSLYCAGDLVPLLPMPSLHRPVRVSTSAAATSSEFTSTGYFQQDPNGGVRISLLAPFPSPAPADPRWAGLLSAEDHSAYGHEEQGKSRFLQLEVQLLHASIVTK